MRFKDGVSPVGVSDRVWQAMVYVDDYLRLIGTGDELWVTSTREGRHMVGSRHYSGEAFDFRAPVVILDGGEVGYLLNEVRELLGADFDVVFEGDHFHVEFDPK